jgi:uncharacterized protein (DUF3820 family)
MDDESIMYFGIHEGKKMANVPSSYLLSLYDSGKCYGEVKEYIEENLDGIKQDVKNSK